MEGGFELQDNTMNDRFTDFIKLVEKMRYAQRAYEKLPDSVNRGVKRKYEEAVDKMLKEFLNPQTEEKELW